MQYYRAYVYGDDPEVRASMAEGLGWIGRPEDKALLLPLLEDEKISVSTIGWGETEKQVRSYPVREKAQQALEEIDKRAREQQNNECSGPKR